VLFGLSPPGPGQTTWTESALEPLSIGEGQVQSISGLVTDSSGTLYGITSNGGGCGAVFAFRVWQYAFTGGVDGCYSGASLALDAHNNLYVANTSGGAYGKGVVFQLVSGTEMNVLHSFGATTADGTSPSLSSRADARGALYGATAGGPGGAGTVFELDPPAAGKTTWSELVLRAFTGHADGGSPAGALFFGASGALYGAANGGGKGYGLVFELTPGK
jgi:uncharacterized repeat protein (TIGR03803 family)